MSIALASADARDERALMGPLSGVLWLVAAVTAGVGRLLPGTPSSPGLGFAVVDLLVIAYSIACITRLIRWERASLRWHALGTAVLLPLVGLLVWNTGGADSYAQPLSLFPLLYIAFFFPIELATPLVVELVIVYAAPLLYEPSATSHAFPARSLSFGVAAAIVTMVLRNLKTRMVEAESRQREMACTDALTGVANRRRFDSELTTRLAEPGCAVLVLDLDGFKLINDSMGHHTGDEVLRSVGAACATVVRPGDTVARIGGDEFAVVAPRAGELDAQRLAEALERATLEAGCGATVAWAVHPADGVTEDELLRAADHRLYERKRNRGAPPLVEAV